MQTTLTMEMPTLDVTSSLSVKKKKQNFHVSACDCVLIIHLLPILIFLQSLCVVLSLFFSCKKWQLILWWLNTGRAIMAMVAVWKGLGMQLHSMPCLVLERNFSMSLVFTLVHLLIYNLELILILLCTCSVKQYFKT